MKNQDIHYKDTHKKGKGRTNVKVSDFEDDINFIEEKIVEATESDAMNTKKDFNKQHHNYFDDLEDDEEDKDDD